MASNNKARAKKSAEDIGKMAKFIESTLTLNFPDRQIKAIVNVPIKQMEDELGALKAYIKTLK
jgi:uncharacterized protein YpuA (DUF1002 family)